MVCLRFRVQGLFRVSGFDIGTRFYLKALLHSTSPFEGNML